MKMINIFNMWYRSYREIESHPVSVSNIKQFINKYNCEGINYPSNIYD